MCLTSPFDGPGNIHSSKILTLYHSVTQEPSLSWTHNSRTVTR
jgi:hypothetical protein